MENNHQLLTAESVYCPNCKAIHPVKYDYMRATKYNRNEHNATDIMCADCCFIVATLHHPSTLAKFHHLAPVSAGEGQAQLAELKRKSVEAYDAWIGLSESEDDLEHMRLMMKYLEAKAAYNDAKATPSAPDDTELLRGEIEVQARTIDDLQNRLAAPDLREALEKIAEWDELTRSCSSLIHAKTVVRRFARAALAGKGNENG